MAVVDTVKEAPDAPGTTSTDGRPSRQRSTILPMVLRRLLIMIPTLWGIVTLAFILTHVLGGNPARQIAGQAAAPATVAKISHDYGFDKPVLSQYWSYLTGIVHGDLGTSTVTDESVLHDLTARFPATLELILCSIVLALLIGVPLGAYAGRTRHRGAQNAIRSFTFLTLAVPDFWLALVALYLFFFKWGVLPAPTGQNSLSGPTPNHVTGAALLDSILTGNWPAFENSFDQAILPIGVLGVLLSAPITRLMRGATITVMESDFMRFATAVGLGRRWVWRYVVRAAIPTVITFTGTLFTLLCGGAVLMETVFSWGGAAQYAANAIQRNDFAATQGFVLVCGFLAMLAFLVVDLIQLKLDPRIRTVGSGRGWRAALQWRTGSPVLASALIADPALAGASGADLAPDAAVSEASAPSGLSRRPRSLAERCAPFGEWWQVLVELVRDCRPQRMPAAVWRTIRSGNVALLSGATIVVVLVAAAFILPLFWPYDALTPDALHTLAAPSASHPFGTDNSGFDLFIRVIVAARTDLWIAGAGVFLSAAAGVALGVVIGFSRQRWVDDVVMRIVDMIQAFPVLIVAIALVAFAGNNLTNVVWALTFINTPIFLRLARGQVLTVREHRYVEAAAAMGNSRIRIIVRHVFPNIVGQAIVQVGISLGYALLTIAGLAFLGVGVQAPTAEWGSMILSGKDAITTGQWWTVTFPGLAILIAVAGFNLLADGIEKQRDIYR